MEALLTTFGKAFDEVDIYSAARPSKTYLDRIGKCIFPIPEVSMIQG